MDDDLRVRFEPLYRDTDYAVEDVRLRCTLSVDGPCDALSDWLQAQGCDSAAFITACNPLGAPRPEVENQDAMRKLQQAVEALGLPALNAVGRAQTGDHHEPSVLVPGLSLNAAHALMRRFQQNAFVWFERADGRARLEWVHPSPDQ